jgi:hypothetical protein
MTDYRYRALRILPFRKRSVVDALAAVFFVFGFYGLDAWHYLANSGPKVRYGSRTVLFAGSRCVDFLSAAPSVLAGLQTPEMTQPKCHTRTDQTSC